jgi:hypothetical protein
MQNVQVKFGNWPQLVLIACFGLHIKRACDGWLADLAEYGKYIV